MIKANRIDDHEIRQIVFVRNIISMPGDDIKARLILCSQKELSLEFRYDLKVWNVTILEPCCRCEKIAWIGESICSRNKIMKIIEKI